MYKHNYLIIWDNGVEAPVVATGTFLDYVDPDGRQRCVANPKALREDVHYFGGTLIATVNPNYTPRKRKPRQPVRAGYPVGLATLLRTR